jgi:hypothetical protein
LGKRSRKRTTQPAKPQRRPAKPAAPPESRPASREPAGNGAAAKPVSRSEAKNAAARAALEPLGEGERPQVVTVAAVVAALLGLANAVPFFFGIEVRGDDPQPGVLVFSFVLLVAAWGMWKAKYWAVLGMQALLALIILVFSLLLTTAENWHSALIAVAVVAAAGTLFWKLVKALARIQMPERRPS